MIVNIKKLVLSTDLLPSCPKERRARLDSYFDDVLASVTAVPEGWEIDLNWPSTADYFVDPCIEKGLAWWRPGSAISEVHMQVSYTPRGQLSLNDAWTLYSWSNWLADRRKCGHAIAEVVILHVDDHTDLMTPRLTFQEDGLEDAISGRTFDIYEPESVRSAILSGAVGVGSFMSPFIHAFPQVHLRHLSQTAPDEDAQDFALVAESIPDTLLNTNAFRPAIGISKSVGAYAGHYRLTRKLTSWLSELPDAPVLLHVDMDYFNNRYNGDSDWETRVRKHDPDLTEILPAIDKLFSAINDAGVASRIENVTVALSPRFFPAELWPRSIDRMQEHLAVLGWQIGTPER